MIILQNSTPHKQSKILESFTNLGLPSTFPVITSENRAIVRGFLNGLGFQTHDYINASIDELEAAYHSIASAGMGLIPFICASDKLAAPDVLENIRECMARCRYIDGNAVSGSLPDLQTIQYALDKMPDKGGVATTGAGTGTDTMPITAAATIPSVPMENTEALNALAAFMAAIGNTGNKPAAMDETRIIELIRKYSVSTTINLVTNTKEITIPTGAHHKKLPEIVKYLSAGVHVFMVGAAGSGKTTIAEQAAKILELPFYFNGALDSEYKLTGFIDAQGRIISTAFRKAYEGGGVYLFDEVDASMPSALLAFNAALANGHSDFPDGCVKRHENFRCIAAANTYGKGADRLYVGRNQLDAATLDRFAVITVDYDEKLEKVLTGNDEWCEYVQSIRKAVHSLKIRHVVSPRASINGAKLLAAGVSKDNVIDSIVWKGLDSDSITKIKAAA